MINKPDFKNTKKTKIPCGTLYEYDNGLKILYDTDSEKTTVGYSFLGGSHSQKFEGLAHFVEHSLFFSDLFNKSATFTSGWTSKVATFYEARYEHENLSKLNDETARLQEKSKIREKIYNNIDIFFDEAYGKGWLDGSSPQFTIRHFEEEKNIIDEEYRKRYEDKEVSVNRFAYLNSAKTSLLSNCGDAETLKSVTIQDVIDFKENNYVLENFVFIIRTPLDYEEIENMIVEKLSSRIKSNPKGKVENIENALSYHFPDEKYHIYFEPEKKDKRSVDVSLLFELNPTPETLKNDLIAFYIMRSLFKDDTTLKKIRYQDRLVYGSSTYYDVSNYTINFDRRYSVKKENLSKLLNSEIRCLKDIFINDFDIERYYRLKAEIEIKKKHIKRYVNNNCSKNPDDYYLYLQFTDKFLNECQDEFKNLTYEQMQDIIKYALDKGKLNIFVKGNIELKDLPSIDYLSDKLRSKDKDISAYPKNMQEDLYKSKKVVDISKPTSKALTIYKEPEM